MKLASRDLAASETHSLAATKDEPWSRDSSEKKKKVLRIHAGTEIWTEINKGLKFTSVLN